MSNLYLTKLIVNEFRTFSQCEVVLPDSPGVLLVCGPNGLGKSTLFDGLEWCLSGKVDRFEQASRGVTSDQYLRSWHSQTDRQTSVQATFSGDLSTLRSIVGTQEVQSGEEPAGLLQSNAWKSPIGDLHNYLLLTHFLGQSTLTRMTHRKADQRWEYLKGPARSDWATEIATSLHGHGNSAEAKAFVAAARAAELEAQRLDDLLRAESTLFESSSVAGSIAEPQVITEAAMILNGLKDLTADVAIDAVQQATGPRALEQLSRAVAALQAWRTRRATILERAGACLRQFNEANSKVAELQATLPPLEASLLELQQKVSLSAIELQQAEAQHQEARTASRALEARVTALEALRTLLDRRAQLQKNRLLLDSEASTLESDVASAEARTRVAERRLLLAQSIDNKLRGLLQEIETDIGRRTLRGHIENLDRQILALRNGISVILNASSNLELQLQQAQARQSSTSERLQAANTTLASARSAVGRLIAAVVSVASNINDSTCVCPVCATDFEPGELRRRSAAAADALGPTLAPLEEIVRQAEAEALEANAGVAVITLQVGELHQRRQDLAILVADRNAKIAQLNVSLGEGAQSEPAPATARPQALQKRAERARHWLRVIGEPGALQSAWSTALTSRNDLAARYAETQRARDGEAQALGRSEEDIQFTLQTLGQNTASEADDELLSARTRRVQAEQRVFAANVTLQNVQAVVSDLNQKLAATAANQKTLLATLGASRAEVAQVVSAWKELGMGDDLPTNEARSRAELLAQAAGARVLKADQVLTQLRTGFSIALQQEAHKEGLAQVRNAVTAPASSDRNEIIKLARESQVRSLEKAQTYLRAQQIAQSAYQQINERVGAFNQRYLKPLNDLMSKINRAILTDPDVGLDLEFNRNAVRQKARRPKNAPSSVENLDPLLVHSEGQMAALAVSILCAASLTFTWSRWRGLVMDDPLQHNDVLHASAFADLMRNLVRENGYQVLVSTHDMGQADFLRRKFVAGNVPCTVVQLVGRSKEGTLIRIEDKFSSAA
jgi:DNA repair exonuclease SbcCD ATPase subunit